MKKNSKPKKPSVTVVMPVYNAARYLRESIESILTQTYANFEFIVIDDASTDSSWDILKSYAKKDKRMKVYRNYKNSGVSLTVKRAMEIAKGEYIARMDADDITLPYRLEKQVEFLMQNPKTVAVGGQCITIDAVSNMIGEKTFPIEFEKIYQYIFTFVPVQQPTLMIARKRLPKDFEFYVDGMNTAEEIELLFKLFKYGKVENLKDYVHLYRIHSANTSFKNIRKTFYLTLFSRIKALFNYGYKPKLKDIVINVFQLIAITVLPQKVSLKLYKLLRKTSSKRSSSFKFKMSPSFSIVDSHTV